MQKALQIRIIATNAVVQPTEVAKLKRAGLPMRNASRCSVALVDAFAHGVIIIILGSCARGPLFECCRQTIVMFI